MIKKMTLSFLALLLFFSPLQAKENIPSFPYESIFWLNSLWKRNDGKEMMEKKSIFKLSETPTIISMVFLSCKYSCPLTIQDMREMDEILKKKEISYKMVLISIDPERDTPETMRNFMNEKKLDSQRWSLLIRC